MLSLFSSLILALCLSVTNPAKATGLNVLHYSVHLKPDLPSQSVEGQVVIEFELPLTEQEIVLDAGNLEIEGIEGESVTGYSKQGSKLHIQLSNGRNLKEEITVHYHGSPKRGLLFHPEASQAYTVYFTSDWMVCHDTPEDKATLNLNIVVPEGLDCVASGEHTWTEEGLHHWQQNYESPTYTYGFALGKFQQQDTIYQAVDIHNYAPAYTPAQLQYIFRETPGMLAFFEEKSGVPYDQEDYSQILMGGHYQEMSGFSILMESYGKLVFKDSTETNLISHELAHQWWGNRITCESFQHFWLNEAMATYMSAAYNQHRFGEAKYQADIGAYRRVYEGIKSRGNDKPLVFRSWINPSRDDRNIVYFKGAYFLHVLRQELGDQAFWEGIRHYSQQHFDGTVTSQDFQQAMEAAANRELTALFNEWVYP
ncbi:MAG: M1 family metallopeptidase [Bacteroidota bacterium]